MSWEAAPTGVSALLGCRGGELDEVQSFAVVSGHDANLETRAPPLACLPHKLPFVEPTAVCLGQVAVTHPTFVGRSVAFCE